MHQDRPPESISVLGVNITPFSSYSQATACIGTFINSRKKAFSVAINPEKIYIFEWDNEQHKAVVASHRTNHFTKFEYLPESDSDKKDPSYFELRIELNELTQTTFLKVTDYSDFDDLDELHDLWDSLIDQLRKVVGG